MSGGSWDYAYYRVHEVSEKLLSSQNLKRRALGGLCRLLEKALHDIEWVDSGNCEPGDEDAAIDKALAFNSPSVMLGIAIEDATRARDELNKLIAQAKEAKL